ncbi:hypothetical protein NUU61_008965 [Penicillium alfredii]|uniref:AB hydrolase-1 domain-containing protein n=1 Tax=Penicillium alfredii TaxID=1506179 RepID=A0A9W9EMI7_9EURO|nr:uncharacterized protein NUU61_008965 [Penicillium alfredii]KAJ5084386.1 hypothetical protein NUU61_008965 [Penicillium alfredii]
MTGSVLHDPSLQARHGQTATLSDGRQLGFAEFGSQASDATPVLVFHGLPGSRLEAASLHQAGCELNVRVIGVDRPGIGLSSPQPNRKLLDWPADMKELAKHLNIQQYYVLGISAGGPYALACASQLPETELLGVGIISGMGPWHLGTPGVTFELRVLLNSMAYAPWLARALLDYSFVGPAQDPNPAKLKGFVEGAATRMNPSDREFCERPDVVDTLVATLRESYRNGAGPTVDEGQILTSDWGLELEKITATHVRMWYGTEDCNTPVSLGQYMVERIPGAILKEYKGDSHFTIRRRATEMLQELVTAG